MLVDLTLFFFVLLGSKLLLGAVAVYLLLPRYTQCAVCDAETLPLVHARGTSRVLRAMRLQRRWCMECRRESLTAAPLRSGARAAPHPVPETHVR